MIQIYVTNNRSEPEFENGIRAKLLAIYTDDFFQICGIKQPANIHVAKFDDKNMSGFASGSDGCGVGENSVNFSIDFVTNRRDDELRAIYLHEFSHRATERGHDAVFAALLATLALRHDKSKKNRSAVDWDSIQKCLSLYELHQEKILGFGEALDFTISCAYKFWNQQTTITELVKQIEADYKKAIIMKEDGREITNLNRVVKKPNLHSADLTSFVLMCAIIAVYIKFLIGG